MDGLLEIDSLTVNYGPNRALASVSLGLGAGESLAVVGESGSGKSTLLRSIARLLPRQARIESGAIEFRGTDLVTAPGRVLRSLRGSQIAYVFQNGRESLDPLFTVGRQLDEVLRAHGKEVPPSWGEALLRRMGIEDPGRVLATFPRELSGGQCQRVAVALSVACGPSLLLADEPTGGLNEEARDKVGGLLGDLNAREGVALVTVTHDIGFAAQVARRIAVMRGGRIVEEGPTERVMARPSQPYTRELIDAVPRTERTFRRVGDGA